MISGKTNQHGVFSFCFGIHRGKTVQTLFKTDGKSLRDNYATLFGAKSAMPLLDLDLTLEVEAAKRVLKTAGLDEL